MFIRADAKIMLAIKLYLCIIIFAPSERGYSSAGQSATLTS
jgi:hypothetical protein